MDVFSDRGLKNAPMPPLPPTRMRFNNWFKTRIKKLGKADYFSYLILITLVVGILSFFYFSYLTRYLVFVFLLFIPVRSLLHAKQDSSKKKPQGIGDGRSFEVGDLLQVSGSSGESVYKVVAVDDVNNSIVYSFVVMSEVNNSGHGKGFSMKGMHLPVSARTLATWNPSLVGRAAISEVDLDGYKIWKESRGGAF